MKIKDHPSKEMAKLHSRAEERLKTTRDKASASPQETDIHRLYHELQVHQVELEMQNDELRRAQVRLEESRSLYECLYDFSPVGYLTFDRKGRIEAINLTGASLLGLERQRLLKAPFTRFVQPDSANLFLSHIERVFTTAARHTCELWLNVGNHRRLHVAMESILVECDDGDPVQCHSAVMDITERKKAEEVLNRYELLAGHSRDIILFVRRDDGRILEANTAALKAYGYGREELLSMTIYDLRASETKALIPAEMAKADGRGLLFESVHRRKDGRTFPVEVGSQGATIGDTRMLISVIRDITKRRKMEEALREREELFRMTFEKSPIPAAMVDLEQRITLPNKEFCRMLGYAAEEIVGMTLRDITHPDDVEGVLGNFRMMSAGRIDGYRMEKRYIRKGGGIVWGQLSASVIRDADGRPSYGVGMIEDITERRRAERYQRLVAEILRILNDPSTLDDSINLILAAIQRETGFDAVGIRLRSGDDFPYLVQNGFSPDFLLTENALVARDASGSICRDEKGNISLECTCGLVISGQTDPTNPLVTKGGSFWTNNSLPLLDLPAEQDPRLRPRNTCIHKGFLSVALIPIHAEREIVGLLQLNDRRADRFTREMISLFEGIAESIGVALLRKQTEKRLEERTVQLENANRELESFSYSVSHDLRAPLRAIDGYSRMILKRQGDRFDDETRRQFNLVRDNTRMMAQLIDDILAFSRLGKQAITTSRIDMEVLAKEIWNELRTINPDRDMVLNIDRPPFGMGDRALIKQVLSNLFSNAVKFTRGRDAAVIEIGGRIRENEIVYHVRDNGTGFDMKYYDRLFGVFQRLHDASEFEGTGVGLAIVQRIIHRHGGRVWAEGEPDRGATFYFTLPARTG